MCAPLLSSNADITKNPDILPPHTMTVLKNFPGELSESLFAGGKAVSLVEPQQWSRVVTASRMFFSACEWRQYAANCTVWSEIPAKASLEIWTDRVPGGSHGSRAGQTSSRGGSVFVAPWLRHRHCEGISARVDVESLVSGNFDQLPSFHGGGRSHPGWRSRWSFTTSMWAPMKSSYLLRVRQKTPRNVVKASGQCVLFHSSLNGGLCPWCLGSCPLCLSDDALRGMASSFHTPLRAL